MRSLRLLRTLLRALRTLRWVETLLYWRDMDGKRSVVAYTKTPENKEIKLET